MTGMNCPCFAKCDRMRGRKRRHCETDCDNTCQNQVRENEKSSQSKQDGLWKHLSQSAIQGISQNTWLRFFVRGSCHKLGISDSFIIMNEIRDPWCLDWDSLYVRECSIQEFNFRITHWTDKNLPKWTDKNPPRSRGRGRGRARGQSQGQGRGRGQGQGRGRGREKGKWTP